MSLGSRRSACTTDNMISLASNTCRRYKLGTEAVFAWLSDALDKIGIILDTELEDTSIRSKPTLCLLLAVFLLPWMNMDKTLLTDNQTSLTLHLKPRAQVHRCRTKFCNHLRMP